ncbi:MAG: hypothetical protein AB1744_02500, partial [Candidatus Zixiibacteriota bacterium]
NYREIGRRAADPNPNLDLIIYEYIDQSAELQNGVTYYYAVSSVDAAGQISELSAENAFDTPRPEGRTVLADSAVDAAKSGFHFGTQQRVHVSLSDVFVDQVNGVFYLNVGNLSTDLQDMGQTDSFDDIGWAPQTGWSANGWAELITGHTYVIRTGSPDNVHYAKMWVEGIDEIYSWVSFQWAYQVAKDNPELSPGAGSNDGNGSEDKRDANVSSEANVK